MKRIIIDCDPGNGIAGANTDDGLALALALGSPALQVEMITTVSGNTPCKTGRGSSGTCWIVADCLCLFITEPVVPCMNRPQRGDSNWMNG